MGTALVEGVGNTVMVKVLALPVHPLACGVTVMVATIFIVPALTAVKTGRLPDPLAANPIPGTELVQVYVVPGTGPVKVTRLVDAPLQIVIFAEVATVGFGLIRAETVVVSLQPFPSVVITV